MVVTLLSNFWVVQGALVSYLTGSFLFAVFMTWLLTASVRFFFFNFFTTTLNSFPEDLYWGWYPAMSGAAAVIYYVLLILLTKLLLAILSSI